MFGLLAKKATEQGKKIDQQNHALKLKMFEELKVQKLYLANDIPVPAKIQLDYYSEILTLYKYFKKPLPEIALKKEKFKKKNDKIVRSIIFILFVLITISCIYIKNDYGLFIAILFTVFALTLAMITTALVIKNNENNFNKKILSELHKDN